mgnify:CR=1 FL=1
MCETGKWVKRDLEVIVPVYNSVDEDDKVLVFKEVLSFDKLYLTKLYNAYRKKIQNNLKKTNKII